MKNQESADADRQLAMYSIWVKDKFKDAKKVILLWNMLAFNKEVTSERTEEQLNKLHQATVSVIKEIEDCKDFKPNITALCDWCVYKKMCPSFKHEAELEEKTPEEFKDDDGVKLVDDYSELDYKEKEIKKQKEEIKQKLIGFSVQKEINVVFGSNKKVSVKEYEKVVYPEDKEEFVKLLKEKGVYDTVSMISYPKLNSMILKEEVDKEVLDKVEKDKDYRISVSKKRKIED